MKRNLTLMIVAIAFIFASCEKENPIMNDIKPIQKGEMVPIAKLTENNEIVHLFLQKDAQEFFSKESSAVYGSSSKNTSNTRLVFVEVKDNNKNDKEAELLYRIYNDETKVVETSISTVLTLENGIYYAQVGGGAGTTLSCTTSNRDCTQEANGCVPYGITCKPCSNTLAICTRTVFGVANTMVISAVIGAAN